ncbi:MAG: glycine oxidase ThiO [Thermoanaerobaculia bacterium]
MAKHPDVLVLGAGLIGLAAARELAGRGLSVELLEARHPGAGASSAGAGLLAPISDWESTRPFIDICRRARDDWRTFRNDLVAESGIDIEYDTSGGYLIAHEPGDDATLDETVAIAATAGEDALEVDVDLVRAVVSDLTPAARRALHLAGEHRVDNVAACAALAESCRRRGVVLSAGFVAHRVAFPDRQVVVESSQSRRHAGHLVVASGAWCSAIAGLPDLPVRPIRGQMLRIEGANWPFAGSLRCRHEYVVRRGTAGLLVGATVEEAGFAEYPTVAGVEKLLDFARRLFPGLASARLESTWAGLRPGSPDGRPLLGPWSETPLTIACGHYRNGILLAPWSGRQIARSIVDREAIESAELFSPHRFGHSSTVADA